MSDATPVAIAKAVTAALAAATLSQSFVPERSYADWDLDLTKLDALELKVADKLFVDVVAHTTEGMVDILTRAKQQYTVPIDIAVRRKMGPDKQNPDTGRIDVAEVDGLMLLVEEIHKFFFPPEETTFGGGEWDSTQIVAAPIREHLRQMRQFTGIVRLNFIAYT